MAINAASLTIDTQIIGAGVTLAVLNTVSQAVVGAGRAAVGAYSEYERLSSSLTSLVAREKLKADSTLSMTTAMAQSSGEAQRLQGWITRLAILSPFNEAGVANAFKTAQSYNFVSDSMDKNVVTAKRLSQAMIDYTAGSGQTEDTMSRIALALGQMNAAGKVTGQDLGQLTSVGVSVNDYLARAFKTTTSQIVDMREKGLIPADAAIRGIVEGLERDFGGAAARQGNLLSGLTASLEDIQSITSRRVFSGFFEEAKPILSDIVNTLQSPAFDNRIDTFATGMKTVASVTAEMARASAPALRGVESLVSGGAEVIGAGVTTILSAAQSLKLVRDITPESLGREAVPLTAGLATAYGLLSRTRVTDAATAQAQASAQQGVNNKMVGGYSAALTQAAAFGAITLAVAAATDSYIQYQEAIKAGAAAQFAGSDKAISDLEKRYYNRNDETPKPVESAKANIEEEIAALKKQQASFESATVADVQIVATRRLIAELVGDVTYGVIEIGRLFTRVMLEPVALLVPAFKGSFDGIMRGLDGLEKQNPLRGWVDSEQDAANKNAQVRQQMLKDSRAHIDAEITDLKRLESAYSNTANTQLLSDEAKKSYTDLAKLRVDFQQGEQKRARDYAGRLAEIEQQKNEQLADLSKQYWSSVRGFREQAIKDGTSALDPVIQSDVGFLNDDTQRREQHNAKLQALAKQGAFCKIPEEEAAFQKQEQVAAIAYAKQQAMQQQHLGRMLVDYVRAQGLLMGVSASRIDAMTSAIRDEYGITATLAERSFGQMQQAIDAWAANGGKSTESYIGQLRQTRTEAVRTQIAIDDLTKQRTEQLAKDFAAGRLSREQYLQQLQDVPKNVNRDLGLAQSGAVQSEKLVQLDRDTGQKRYDISVTQYRKQVAAAAKAYQQQENEAVSSYARQEIALQTSLMTMDKLLKDSTDRRLAEQVRATVAFNAVLDKQLAVLLARRDQMSSAAFDAALRDLIARAAAMQSTLPDATKLAGRDRNDYEPPARDVTRTPASTYAPPGATRTPLTPPPTPRAAPQAPTPRNAQPVSSRGYRAQSVTVNTVVTVNGGIDSDERVQQVADRAAQQAKRAVMDEIDSQVDDYLLAGSRQV